MSERRIRWIARVGAVAVRLLGWTWRVRFINPEIADELRARRQPFVYILWHGELLPLLWTHRHRQIAVIISEHSDGEMIARVAQSLGFRTVRGSTSRGAARALLSASREVDAGHCLAITVDGPRGPAHEVAPGALIISQRTSAPMLPTAASASRAWRLRSWDRFMIPKPFARVRVAYGEPLVMTQDSAREAAEHVRAVADAIEAASRLATVPVRE
jgi:lysophospholipid acyltransferase (LPLAT)-like uncharacterized protein